MKKNKVLEICDDNEFDLDWNSEEGKEFRKAVKQLVTNNKIVRTPNEIAEEFKMVYDRDYVLKFLTTREE